MTRLAVWTVTRNGAGHALKVAKAMPGTRIYCTHGIRDLLKWADASVVVFEKLSLEMEMAFNQYDAHLFIMSTGIAVRVIAPYIKNKTMDPAVVVLDDRAVHCISLLSGHLGGANELASKIASITRALPVITTATDLNRVPAMDMIARRLQFHIENPDRIKIINMAFLNGDGIMIHDVHELIRGELSGSKVCFVDDLSPYPGMPSVLISHRIEDVAGETLVLRPPILAVGIGCNRNTSGREIEDFFSEVMAGFSLSERSVFRAGSIDLKKDEDGLLEFAGRKGLSLEFFEKERLNRVENIKTPSPMAEKYTGARSVCEAAAVLAAEEGELIVPKQVKGNVTLAVAQRKTPSI